MTLYHALVTHIRGTLTDTASISRADLLRAEKVIIKHQTRMPAVVSDSGHHFVVRIGGDLNNCAYVKDPFEVSMLAGEY